MSNDSNDLSEKKRRFHKKCFIEAQAKFHERKNIWIAILNQRLENSPQMMKRLFLMKSFTSQRRFRTMNERLSIRKSFAIRSQTSRDLWTCLGHFRRASSRSFPSCHRTRRTESLLEPIQLWRLLRTTTRLHLEQRVAPSTTLDFRQSPKKIWIARDPRGLRLSLTFHHRTRKKRILIHAQDLQEEFVTGQTHRVLLVASRFQNVNQAKARSLSVEEFRRNERLPKKRRKSRRS